MEAVVDLPVAIPEHLQDEFLRRLPFVSDAVDAVRLLADRKQVAFVLRAGTEGRASAIAADIIDVACRLCQGGVVPPTRVLHRRQRLPSSYDEDPHRFLEGAGELVRFGSGRYGLGPRLTSLVGALDGRLRRMAAALDAGARTFPALIGADALDRCRYLRNFPTALTLVAHLREDHAGLQEFARTAYWDGDALSFDTARLSRVECLLAPAVCFHWYTSLANSMLRGPQAISAAGRCFRYESRNLSGLERLWDFTMRELVFAGTRDYVLDRREACLAACKAFLEELGLAYEICTATDPFFVDAYAMQAAYQQGFELKLEFRVPLPYAGRGMAAGSLNYHQDFFGRAFGIAIGDAAAHTCCLGFGLERLALGILAQYGVDESKWPVLLTESLR